jgi:hypothetical protein
MANEEQIYIEERADGKYTYPLTPANYTHRPADRSAWLV